MIKPEKSLKNCRRPSRDGWGCMANLPLAIPGQNKILKKFLLLKILPLIEEPGNPLTGIRSAQNFNVFEKFSVFWIFEFKHDNELDLVKLKW